MCAVFLSRIAASIVATRLSLVSRSPGAAAGPSLASPVTAGSDGSSAALEALGDGDEVTEVFASASFVLSSEPQPASAVSSSAPAAIAVRLRERVVSMGPPCGMPRRLAASVGDGASCHAISAGSGPQVVQAPTVCPEDQRRDDQ